MNSFKNPLTPLVPNPVGIEVPINALQTALGTIPWIEKSFGRSWRTSREDVKGKNIFYPEVWQGLNRDLLNVMPNDNLQSQCFWYEEGAEEVKDWCAGSYSMIELKINLILWFNLKCIDPTVDNRFTETIKAEILNTLRMTTLPLGTISVKNIYHEPEDVFKWFTIDKTIEQSLTHPYGGFRFECMLNYKEECQS